MIRIVGFCAVVLVALMSCATDRPQSSDVGSAQLEVTVSKDEGMGPHLVTAHVPRKLPRFNLQDSDGKTIATQLDRIDQLTNQLTFLTDGPVGEKMTFSTNNEVAATTGKSGVNVMLRSHEDEEITEWNALQPKVKEGGIILSNSWLGYHIALDHVKLLPLLTKDGEQPGIANAMIELGGHGGLATLGLYNYDGVVPLTDYESAEVEVIADGPVRAVVQIRLAGIKVRKEKLSVQLDYMFYADKPYVDIDMQITSKSNLELKFAIGLPRHPEAPHFTLGKKDNCHFAYTFGTQSRDGLFLGHVFFVTDSYQTDIFNEDEANHYLLIDPLDNGLKARAMSLHSSDRLAISEESSFIDQIRLNAASYGSPPTASMVTAE